jgi:hypothetical protein
LSKKILARWQKPWRHRRRLMRHRALPCWAAGLAIRFKGGDVVKRPQQTADITPRAVLFAPLRQRLRWLTFKIDKKDITGGNQYLPQVQVAVQPDTLRADPGLRQRRQQRQQRRTLRQQLLRHGGIGGPMCRPRSVR